MKNLSQNFLLAMALCFSILSSSLAFAEKNNDLAAKQLIESGIAYYLGGDPVRAIHEFSMALKMDPSNQKAKYYLDKVSSSGYFSNLRRPSFLRFNMETIEGYKGRISDLNKENKNLRKQIKISNKDLIKKDKEIASLNLQLQKKLALIDKKDQRLLETEKTLVELSREFRKEKDVWHKERLALRKKLESFTKEAYALKKEEQRLNKKLLALATENEELFGKIYKNEKEAKKKSALDKALMENMKITIRRQSDQITDLKDRTAEINSKLSKKVVLLKKKKNEIKKAKSDFRKTANNLKSIEKNWNKHTSLYRKQIKTLEDENEKFMKKITKLEKSKDRRISELNDTLRKNTIKIAYITNKMLYIDQQAANKDGQLLAKNKQIVDLKEDIAKLKEALLNHEFTATSETIKESPTSKVHSENIELLKKQDDLIFQLKEKLLIAQNKIKELNLKEEENNIEISKMRDRLVEIELRLKNNELSLQNKTDDYDDLNEELTTTLEKIEVIKNQDSLSLLEPAQKTDRIN